MSTPTDPNEHRAHTPGRYRTPRKIKSKKAVAKTLLDERASAGDGGSRSRLRLAVDPGLIGSGDLGELDDDDNASDTWGGDDDIDLSEVKAVERAAARRAHEKAVEEKRKAKRAAREAATGSRIGKAGV